MKAGIQTGISDTEYDKIDAVRNSTLLNFRRSAAHAREKIEDPPESSSAQVLGSALHRLVLEPDTFFDNFAKAPSQTKKKKAEQDAWAAVQAQFPDCRILRPSEWNLVHRMRDQIMKHSIARELVAGFGINEATLLWQDPETKVWCKARPDRMIQHFRNVWTESIGPALLDIKTSRDASPHEFSRSILTYGYDVQAAHYLAGAAELSGTDGPERQWVFIVVENEPPHCVAVYQMEPAGLERGQRLRNRYLRMYAEAKERDLWPGYPEEVSLIGPPAWAYKQEGVEGE